MQREQQPTAAATPAADLERRRLAQRAVRMESVIRELRLRARFHEERLGRVPPPLRHAIAGFVLELRSLDRRLGELSGGSDSPRRGRTRRFDSRSAAR
jgi:uncharacterized membrane protein YccC